MIFFFIFFFFFFLSRLIKNVLEFKGLFDQYLLAVNVDCEEDEGRWSEREKEREGEKVERKGVSLFHFH